MNEECGAQTVFWPGVEDCEATCALEADHTSPHEDPWVGEWDDDE